MDMGQIPGKIIAGPSVSIFKLFLTPKLKQYLGERNLRNALYTSSYKYLDQQSCESGTNLINYILSLEYIAAYPGSDKSKTKEDK